MGQKRKRVKVSNTSSAADAANNNNNIVSAPAPVEVVELLDPALETIFSKSVLVHKIFGELSLDEILPCRLVCKKWRNVVSSHIQCRDNVWIEFTLVNIKGKKGYELFDSCSPLPSLSSSKSKEQQPLPPSKPHAVKRGRGSKIKDTIRDDSDFKPQVQQKKNLDELVKLLGDSPYPNNFMNFPCSYFVFHNGDLNTKEARDFFSKYGKLIRTLHFHNLQPTKQSLFYLLTQQVPRLSRLSLGRGVFAASIMYDIAKDRDLILSMAELEVLHLDQGFSTGQWRPGATSYRMVEGAGKLKAIAHVPVLSTSSPLLQDRFHLIKQLSFILNQSPEIDDLRKLLKSPSRPRTLEIVSVNLPTNIAKPAEINVAAQFNEYLLGLGKIIQVNSGSLRNLHWNLPTAINIIVPLISVPIPVEPKAEGEEEEDDDDFFEEEKFQYVEDLEFFFPKLNHLTMYLNGKSEGARGAVFNGETINRLFPRLNSLCLHVKEYDEKADEKKTTNNNNNGDADNDTEKMEVEQEIDTGMELWKKYFILPENDSSSVNEKIPGSSFPQIKELEIHGEILDSSWWSNLSILFPGVNRLSVNPKYVNNPDDATVTNKIWKLFVELKNLKAIREIKVNPPPVHPEIFSLHPLTS